MCACAYRYAAEMVRHCGIDAWTENSRIVHATSATATGNYTRQDEVRTHCTLCTLHLHLHGVAKACRRQVFLSRLLLIADTYYEPS